MARFLVCFLLENEIQNHYTENQRHAHDILSKSSFKSDRVYEGACNLSSCQDFKKNWYLKGHRDVLGIE